MAEESVVSEVADSGMDTGGGFDVETASSDLASDLFPESASQEDSHDNGEADVTLDADPADESTEATTDEPATEEVPTRPAPKTWPKEMHDHWAKTPKEVQDYWETREKQMLDGLDQYKADAGYGKQMKDAITPYMALIQAQGIEAPQAVQTLLNAHYKLSVSSPSQKAEYFNHLAKQYGVDLAGIAPQQDGQPQIDPMVRQLQDELHNIKQVIHNGNQEQINAERAKIQNEVNAFASDAAHPYFDEVSDEIVAMLKSGANLQDAYEKAVWANPVTRQKEIARLQTEQEKTIREKAIAEAAAAKKASSTTIRNRDSQRTPTGPRATMRNLDDVLRETQREINSRH
jgi:hypothetical protein